MIEETDPAEESLEELTAYLDGELEPAEVQRVEARLGSDTAYRAQLQALQKTWDLLEILPAEVPDSSFVKTTMEMAIQDAVVSRQHRNRRSLRWIFRNLLFVLLLLGAFGIACYATMMAKTAPHRQLVNDLMLIENLDRYNKVDRNLEFLTRLDEWGLFADDATLDSQLVEALPADWFAYNQRGNHPSRETIEDRRRRIDAMDLEQRDDLRRKYAQFTGLSPEQQSELRKFHNELSSHPERDRLTSTLNAYYDWLKTLGIAEQAQLLDLPSNQRLVEISNIKTRQAREAFGRSGSTKLPTAEDAKFLFDWYEMAIRSNENLIRNRFLKVVVQHLNAKGRKIPTDLLNRFAYRQPLGQLVAILFRIDEKAIQNLVFGDMEMLRHGLSLEAREIFDQQTDAEKRQLLLNWIDAANQAKTSVSPERLQEFYEKLPVSERDELDRMAPEDWMQSLTEKYRAQHNPPRILPNLDSPENWLELLNSSGFYDF